MVDVEPYEQAANHLRFFFGGGTRSRSCCFSILDGLRRRCEIFRRILLAIALSLTVVNSPADDLSVPLQSLEPVRV